MSPRDTLSVMGNERKKERDKRGYAHHGMEESVVSEWVVIGERKGRVTVLRRLT